LSNLGLRSNLGSAGVARLMAETDVCLEMNGYQQRINAALMPVLILLGEGGVRIYFNCWTAEFRVLAA